MVLIFPASPCPIYRNGKIRLEEELISWTCYRSEDSSLEYVSSSHNLHRWSGIAKIHTLFALCGVSSLPAIYAWNILFIVWYDCLPLMDMFDESNSRCTSCIYNCATNTALSVCVCVMISREEKTKNITLVWLCYNLLFMLKLSSPVYNSIQICRKQGLRSNYLFLAHGIKTFPMLSLKGVMSCELSQIHDSRDYSWWR